MAQKAEDQMAMYAQLALGILQCTVNTMHNCCKGDIPLCVGLCIKENFCVYNVVLFGFLQIIPRQIVKIL